MDDNKKIIEDLEPRVSLFDKTLLDQIHLVLDSGNDVIIRRDPDSHHLQVESLPFKEGKLGYRDFKFIDEHLDPDDPVIIGVCEKEEFGLNCGYLTLQSMNEFKDEINKIKKNAESLLAKIKDISDNYYCGD